DLPVTDLDQVWVADITYIEVRHGFVYLAAILDKYSKESDRLRHRPAAWKYGPNGDGHGERGSQADMSVKRG
ncbi:MAG: hypothetical protein WCE90_06555, partial [Candidatus Zixiibacteriota bacterium]